MLPAALKEAAEEAEKIKRREDVLSVIGILLTMVAQSSEHLRHLIQTPANLIADAFIDAIDAAPKTCADEEEAGRQLGEATAAVLAVIYGGN